MCGIVGYVGKRPCIDHIFEGLSRLEYRGYDSAGLAVADKGRLHIAKSEGKLERLKARLAELPAGATRGIGHTRWATHGEPTTANAHPHLIDGVALVHNGIIENYAELKEELQGGGVRFHSETDTEVILHLLVQELRRSRSVAKALPALLPRLKGAFSLGIMTASEEDALYVVKQGSPLVIGLGKGENWFASDAMALVKHTSRVHFLDDGEMGCITSEGIEVWDFAGRIVAPRFVDLDLSSASVEKQGFKHFMLKEIHEQPRVISQMIQRLVNSDRPGFNDQEIGLNGIDIDRVENVAMVACGTAFYSALIGKYVFENLVGLPVNVELASEFRYRDPWLTRGSLVIAVSQSGETADTLACVKLARERGCQVLSICNVRMSSIARESHSTLFMEAGPEIGVASTKAFTAMILAHTMLAMAIATRRKKMLSDALMGTLSELRRLPALLDHVIDSKSEIEQLAAKYYEASNFIFMGRGLSYAIALEGALKLKEISYIHAEGYAGGELKHGPIALIDRNMPVLAVVPKDASYEKMVSNVQEVKARQGRIIALGSSTDDKLKGIGNDQIGVPQLRSPALQAILSVVPLQLFAYYVAVRRGTDVDQPRNLAKSVTVE